MKATVKMVLALWCVMARDVVGQAPLAGFWVRSASVCVPASGPRCTALIHSKESWASQIAIDVRGNSVLVAGPETLFMAHVDTIEVDGKGSRWLPGHRGIVGIATLQDGHDARRLSSRPLWAGESWTVSADGRILTHKYQPKADSTLIVYTYQRSADRGTGG